MDKERKKGRHFIIPLPKETVPPQTISSSLGILPQTDRSGRENPSTTYLARSEEFRMRQRLGMSLRGIGSSFAKSPEDVIAQARKEGGLEGLTEFQRQVLVMRYDQGLSQAEIGEILGRDFRLISKTERTAIQKLKGNKDKQQARTLLDMGVIDIDLVPGITDLQRRVMELRYKGKMSGRQVGESLGIGFRRVSEIENTALSKIAFMLSQMKI